MNKIYTLNGKDWMGFIAPEKSEYSYIHNLVTNETSIDEIEYKRAYATARTAALPILNPEIIPSEELEKNLGYDAYDWSGDMKVKHITYTDFHSFEKIEPKGYILSLPNSKDEGKMKTGFELDNKIWKAFQGLLNTIKNLNMQINLLKQDKNDSNQQLAAFKDKLKRAIDVWPYMITKKDVYDLIDEL